MTFPVVAATNNSETSASTSHVFNLPAGIVSGNLLLAIISAGAAVSFTKPAGWEEIVDDDAVTPVTVWIGYRIADGLEGATATATSSGSANSAHVSYRITGAHASAAPEAGTVFYNATSTSPDPPSVTASWGGLDNLFIVALAQQRANKAISAWPANYTGSQVHRQHSGGGGSDGAAAFATRDLTAASDDPGAFTVDGPGDDVKALTLVVRPVETVPQTALFSTYSDVKRRTKMVAY
jgi:hypothetical protein